MAFALIWFAVLGAAFFFLIVRPQRRQVAARRALIASLEVGDEVVTSGGLIGTVRAIEEETIGLEIASGVVVKVARAAVGQRVPPTLEPGDDEVG
jgi:preprotein translocase subunit YajC